MNLEQIGYFLYMEEQEEMKQLKVNVSLESDLEREETATNKDHEPITLFSRNICPFLDE